MSQHDIARGMLCAPAANSLNMPETSTRAPELLPRMHVGGAVRQVEDSVVDNGRALITIRQNVVNLRVHLLGSLKHLLDSNTGGESHRNRKFRVKDCDIQ